MDVVAGFSAGDKETWETFRWLEKHHHMQGGVTAGVSIYLAIMCHYFIFNNYKIVLQHIIIEATEEQFFIVAR